MAVEVLQSKSNVGLLNRMTLDSKQCDVSDTTPRASKIRQGQPSCRMFPTLVLRCPVGADQHKLSS
eukprot:2286127-Amphidinium_carterae.1